MKFDMSAAWNEATRLMAANRDVLLIVAGVFFFLPYVAFMLIFMNELTALEKTWMAHPAAGGDIAKLRAELKAVNERLWVIEDDIRLKEKAQAFDEEFIRLARAVYFENDERARIKKDINLALGSAYVEEKSYQDYRSGPRP